MAAAKKTRDLLDQVVARAGSDPQFRARLLADPAAAVHAAFGVALPHHFRVRFIETPPELDALVVLPRAEEAELEDAELDLVAGGGDTDVDPCNAW